MTERDTHIRDIIIRDIIIALLVAILGGVIVAMIAGEGRFAPQPTPPFVGAVLSLPTQEATACFINETIVVPFNSGSTGVHSQNSYAGTVHVAVFGKGQSAGTQYTDAFYMFTDSEGNPITPYYPNDWILTINGNLANYLIANQQVPSYRDDHTYTFDIDAPGGTLLFGVRDGYPQDNTGSYTITLCKR